MRVFVKVECNDSKVIVRMWAGLSTWNVTASLVELVGVVILRSSFRASIATVNFPVSAKVGNDREVSATALNFASEGLLASVTVHMGLQGTRASKPLVADLALVLLLGARRDLGTELSHH